MNYPPAMARPGLRGDFSALTVVSQVVWDVEESARFYREGLGFEPAFDAWVDDAARPLINEMVGIPSHAELRLTAYRTPGEPDGKTLLLQTRGVPVVSIAPRMRPPNLGAAGGDGGIVESSGVERVLATTLLWCFGLFDRPWAPERKVLGRVRYMSSENTARKFDLAPYFAYVERLPAIRVRSGASL